MVEYSHIILRRCSCTSLYITTLTRPTHRLDTNCLRKAYIPLWATPKVHCLVEDDVWLKFRTPLPWARHYRALAAVGAHCTFVPAPNSLAQLNLDALRYVFEGKCSRKGKMSTSGVSLWGCDIPPTRCRQRWDTRMI